MSRDDFEQLRSTVLADESLQHRLRAFSGRGDDIFGAQLVAVGAERGLRIAAGDVTAALADARRVWLERWLS